MTLLQTFITACGAVIVSGIFGLISKHIDRKAAAKDRAAGDDSTIKKAMQLMMLDRIKWLGQKYIDTGAVDFDDRRLLNQMHEAYHNLGGNGDLDVIMGVVNKLPLQL